MATLSEKPSLNTLEPYGQKAYGNQREALQDTDYAYIAGLIDGDGCISICRQMFKDMRSPYYRIALSVNLTDKNTIEWLNENIPGSQYSTHKERLLKGRKIVYRWALWGPRAERILKSVIPFLKVKKEQAALALQFQKEIVICTAKLNEKRKFCAIPDEELAKREVFYWKMRELKGTADKVSGRPRIHNYSSCKLHPQRLTEMAPSGDVIVHSIEKSLG